MGGLRNLGAKKTKIGSQSAETVVDSSTKDLLIEVLAELKKMNVYLAEMTELHLDHEDIR